MKDVILTFFGIVLLYSLLFNGKESVTPSGEINHRQENPTPHFYLPSDSSDFHLYFYTENSAKNLSANYLFANPL
ncbi:MAG: hypothetical protein LBE91_00570 [Tannerella sp.]|jgi:hypothetical protein|nr:hypothetical protein [Tannerella sp.]